MDRQLEQTAFPFALPAAGREAFHTNPKRQRGNDLTSRLAHRVGVPGSLTTPGTDTGPSSILHPRSSILSRASVPLRQVAALIFAALLMCNLSGCQIVLGVLQIFQGFPMTTCDFTKTTHRKLSEKEKRVVVLSMSVDSARVEVPSLDIDIIAEVSRQLKLAKITVVDEHKVANWIDDHDNITKSTDLEPIGEHFKADFIVLISFEDFGYREENSPDLYRGHAAGKVVVAEMIDDGIKPGKKRAKVIYNKPFNSKYPLNRPISADQEGPDVFKQKFMRQLSQTLSRLFVDYRPEDEI